MRYRSKARQPAMNTIVDPQLGEYLIEGKRDMAIKHEISGNAISELPEQRYAADRSVA
jgi:hypothetical protein